MCGACCLGTPGLQKNTWPKNYFGIPLLAAFLKFDGFGPIQSPGGGEPETSKLKGVPEWSLGQVLCWRLGLPRPTKITQLQEKSGLLALQPKAARQQNSLFREHVCFYWPWHSRPQNKHLAKKSLRDPFVDRFLENLWFRADSGPDPRAEPETS